MSWPDILLPFSHSLPSKHSQNFAVLTPLPRQLIYPAITTWVVTEYFGRDTYNEAIDRLANFALLSANKNCDLGQESFEKKRQILHESGIQINKKIAEYEKWDIDALNECQSWLARQAKTVWRIEGIGN